MLDYLQARGIRGFGDLEVAITYNALVLVLTGVAAVLVGWRRTGRRSG